ncbi:hypothetical protein [Paraliobacillus salinarum]|nr:hypothetical protein [Paraliobacillus salinarum]
MAAKINDKAVNLIVFTMPVESTSLGFGKIIFGKINNISTETTIKTTP